MNLKRYLSTAVAALVLQGCYDDTQMVLDLRGGEFFDKGFPSDLRVDQQGHIDMSGYPKPWLALNPTLIHYRKQVEQNVQGFAPDMPMYMRFEGDIEADDLKFLSNPKAYASSNSPVQLIDVDPNSDERGRRFVIDVEYKFKGDEYRPEDLLQVLPAGQYLKENTTYALVVTRDIAPEHASKLEPNEILNALLKGKDPRKEDKKISKSMASKALSVYQSLRAQWDIEGRDVNDIIGATVWTTGSPSAKMKNLAEQVAQWPAPQPVSEFVVKEETDDYCIIESEWSVPGIQQGAFPYVLPIAGGQVEYTSHGEPIVTYHRTTPFVLTIPKTPMPEQGYPVLFYNHGTDGNAAQVFERGTTVADGTLTRQGSPAQVAAIRGWAATGMGGHFGADHQDQIPVLDAIVDGIDGLSLNIGAYNFMNIKSMRGNMMQMVAERTAFRRLVDNVQLDASLCADADIAASNNGKIYFNQDVQVVMGQSLGSFTAGAQAGTDPKPFQGYIATGAGSYDLQLVMNLAKLPNRKPLGNVLEPLFFYTGVNDITQDRFHPLWAMSDLLMADSDFTHNLSQFHRGDQQDAPHYLVVEGFFDDWVTVPSQQDLLRAMQVDFVGDELSVPTQDQLLPSIKNAGGRQLTAPAGSNVDAARTSAVVRYAEDGIKSGHNVVFQYDQAKHQVGCFLQDIAAGYSPTVVAGESLRGECFSGAAVR